jgi:iron complex outermembrane receptor protein
MSSDLRKWVTWVKRFQGVLLVVALSCPGMLAARALSDEEASQLSLEALLAVEVYSTDRYVRTLSGAASSASVVTAEDIRAFGHRSLTDILSSLPGLYVSYDRNYSYLGSRGFGTVGDWNGRILFLVDGHRVNENIYDGAYIGNDFIVDVALIDRVEYVAGPAAAMLYGNNAFFGVVNVITQSGRQLNGSAVSLGVGSAGTQQARMSYGKRYDSGLEMVLSASRLKSDGRDITVPELGGRVNGLDDERADRLFAKFALGDFSLELARNDRRKGTPNAPYGQVFNDPRSRTIDEQGFINLKYNRSLGAESAISGRLYYGSYDFVEDYVYARAVPPPETYLNRDTATGRWWGGDVKFVAPVINGHKLLLGGDFQHNLKRNQKNVDLGQAPTLDDRREDQTWGLYAHDQIALGQSLTLDVGGRYDQPVSGAGEFHPRLGLLYHWRPATLLKALYGSAFRPPNVFERHYDAEDGYAPNANLKPERIKTYELVLEHQLSIGNRLIANLFRNDIRGLIDYAPQPGPDGAMGTGDDFLRFENLRDVRTDGLELRYERRLREGGLFQASYTGQRTRDQAGEPLQNSPRHLAKLNWCQPLFRTGLHLGVAMQYVDVRRDYAGTQVGSHVLTHLTLSGTYRRDLDWGLRISNVFDRSLADPAAYFHDPIRRIPLDGRNVFLQATYRF